MMNSSPFPTPAKGLPLLGHLVPLLRDPLGFLARLPARGDLVQVRLGPLRALVVCDPDLTCDVLRDDRTFDKGGPVYERLREFAGNGLATCPYGDHRRQRRLLQPAFHPARLPGYARAAAARAAETTGSWQDGQILDVLAVLQELTVRITVDTLFSTTVPPDLLTQALSDLNTLVSGLTVRMATPPPMDRLPTLGNRRYHQARARLPRLLHRLVSERQAAGTDHGDLLSMLLTAQDPVPGPAEQRLTDTEVIDQIVTFFLGATETAASTLAWALHLLGQHPETERRLHAEVDAVLGGRPATHADLPRLELTGRILTETLRLWPSAWGVTRTCTADTHLDRYPVPAGTTIVYSPYLLHHRADLYPDPERFDPDRWAPENPRPPRREAYIPFGGGARKCIGERFVTSEMVLALATIATRWRLRPLPGTRVRPTIGGPTLNPSGLRMCAIARTTTGISSPANREKPQ
ncbi:cytochrome P450 [Streptomyces albireticuli]|uniref:Cytochrome P450 n=1 Tax=Streptomyces albireticuli TaxID=1940 RepID=A0A1Z2LBZ4_9ACTN|nr:cytochrome P450 [Streptomyces albireticuli]ARZ71731.1 cytochrome P450 [Streptomyces albireticuli]